MAPWQQVKCVRVIWDLDLPLADVAANGWKAGRTVAIVRTRWPDGMLFDMTDTVVRKPFLPSEVESSAEFVRITSLCQRRIRQPDGASFFVNRNGVSRDALSLGFREDFLANPTEVFGYSPPVVACWVASRLGQKGAIAPLQVESGEHWFRLVELSVEIAVRESESPKGWYLSRLNLQRPDGTAWWSAEFEEPREYGGAGRLLGSVRQVRVRTEGRKLGAADLPPSPSRRTDYLLKAETAESCADAEFQLKLDGGRVVSMSSMDASQQAMMEQRGREVQAGKDSFAKPRSADGKNESWEVGWIVVVAGACLVAIGVVLGVRRK